jgi:outer membrane protein assembly factor BamB
LNKLLLTSALLLVLFVISGCAQQINTPEGWSGGTISNGTLYIGTRAGDVRALDAATGETRWQFELQGNEQLRSTYGSPVIADNVVYFGGYDGIVYALNPDGTLKWQEPVGGPIVGSPTVADDLVLVGASDGNVYALNAADKSVRWTFETGNRIWSSPTVAGGVAYFGSMDKKVYALSLEDGSKIWEFPTGGAVVSKPAVSDGRVYVGSFDSIFYALDAATGQEVWRFEGAGNWYWSQPLIVEDSRLVGVEDTLYVASLDGNLYALDKNTGQQRWVLHTEGAIVGSPVIVSDMIAVPSDDGRLHVARLSDGVELDACNIGEPIRSSLVEREGLVYLNARDNSIRALRVKPNGNPDEEWVYFATEEDPLARNRAPDC